MSSIVTITLNPAVDKSTIVTMLTPEKKMRCATPKFEPGGGGINVSRAIKKLGGDSTALYSMGGPTGELLKSLLDKEEINQLPIITESWTRENFIVLETNRNGQYRFGMPGQAVTQQEAEQFLNLIKDSKLPFDYLVVSGSTPPTVSSSFYYEVASIAKHKKAKLILDTSGEPLKEALKSGIYLLKPNIDELGELVGKSDLDTVEEQNEAAQSVIAEGKIEVLVVSLGAFGAMVASKEGTHHIAAPSVKKQSTVGAGDSMVGGIVLSLSQGKTILDSVKYGIACGTAATMNSGTELCKLSDVVRLYKWIKEHSN